MRLTCVVPFALVNHNTQTNVDSTLLRRPLDAFSDDDAPLPNTKHQTHTTSFNQKRKQQQHHHITNLLLECRFFLLRCHRHFRILHAIIVLTQSTIEKSVLSGTSCCCSCCTAFATLAIASCTLRSSSSLIFSCKRRFRRPSEMAPNDRTHLWLLLLVIVRRRDYYFQQFVRLVTSKYRRAY